MIKNLDDSLSEAKPSDLFKISVFLKAHDCNHLEGVVSPSFHISNASLNTQASCPPNEGALSQTGHVPQVDQAAPLPEIIFKVLVKSNTLECSCIPLSISYNLTKPTLSYYSTLWSERAWKAVWMSPYSSTYRTVWKRAALLLF